MNRSFLQLACIAAIGALALSAQAQYSAPTQPARPGTYAPAVSPPAAAPEPAPATVPDASSRAAPASIMPDASDMDMDAKVQAEADYRAAQAQCKALDGEERDACLRDADEAYDRPLGEEASMSEQ